MSTVKAAAKQTRDSIKDIWGPRAPYAGAGAWPARVDERLLAEPQRWVPSACLLCSNGCGVEIGVRDGRIVGVRGRADDAVNRGRLGPKGLHGWEANHSEGRLTRPLIRSHGRLRPASWDEALDLIARRTREIVDRYTSGAVSFYTSGQLFLEEYYTLSTIGKAGLGTNHMDGNTRLCTATAAASLRESFGSDGQPACYDDFDEADCVLLVGHNMASTQTVLWSRLLDRRRGANPPKLVVIDPRRTATAAEADAHLAPRAGTNVALLNGILRWLIENGRVDEAFVRDHTMGFEKLRGIVSHYGPKRVAELTGVSPEKLAAAARLIGDARALLSTCLQGVYQSHQATAAACQVNNINLIRGMIGKPGAGVLQMNGQPTAQNNRETGCDGEFPAFRNWQNERHVEQLAEHWNVDPHTIPHWGPPTHAMEIFRLIETGSIRMLWVAGTNPAVSMPDLHRIRGILSKPGLFLVVTDPFMTETAARADVVLPAAIWGEKTGTYTNADRTVHVSLKAVEPPGEARSDFDIWVDYARRMGFKDKDGRPLVKWRTPDEAFEHWKKLSRGALCDYSGMTYEMLAEKSGVRWPCNERNPDGAGRLYADRRFPTSYEDCESYGHDLETGAATTREEYKADDPAGRAILKAADYTPPTEAPDSKYPFWLTTGRIVYHWHTRTKTGRSPELDAAAPGPYVEISEEDARRLGVEDGDELEVSSRRGAVRAPARLAKILPGHVFVPFHFGYWDKNHRFERAANELTQTSWDPVSKQPYFKYAAVQVRPAGAAAPLRRLADAAAKGVEAGKKLADKALGGAHPTRVRVADYLALAVSAQKQFALAAKKVMQTHAAESEVRAGLKLLASMSEESVERLSPALERHGRRGGKEPKAMRRALFPPLRAGAFGLLRDLHDLYLMNAEELATLMIVLQAAKALRDDELLQACGHIEGEIDRQRSWLMTQLKKRAPQSLVVPQ